MARVQLEPILEGSEIAALVAMRDAIAGLEAELSQGLPVREMLSADAANNRVFFNTDPGVTALCWKNGLGQVKEFRLRDL